VQTVVLAPQPYCLPPATFGFGAGWGALSSGGRVGDRGTGMDCAAALVAIGLGMMARLAWRKKRIEAKTKWSKS